MFYISSQSMTEMSGNFYSQVMHFNFPSTHETIHTSVAAMKSLEILSHGSYKNWKTEVSRNIFSFLNPRKIIM